MSVEADLARDPGNHAAGPPPNLVAAYWPGVVAASLGVAVIVGIHRGSPRTLLSAHGFLHSAILQRFQHSFNVPPENPFFAGEPLGYYWFFQALGAGVSSLTGLDPIRSFELLILGAVVCMVACATRLGVHLYRSAPVGALIAFLVFAGANVQAPLLLGYRVLRIGTSVFDERPAYLWGIVHTLSTQLRYADKWGMHGPLVNFFLNITARPLALCATLAVLLAFQRSLARPTPRALLTLAASVMLTSALSVLAGAAVAGSLVAALVLFRLAARTPASRFLECEADSGLDDRTALRAGAALILGLLAASPTYWQLFATGSGGLVIAGDGITGILHALVMLLAACGFGLLLALIGLGLLRGRFPQLAGASGEARHFLIVICVAALGLIGVTSVVSLPVGNQDNFFHVALVMLAVAMPAAALDRNGTLDTLRGWLIGLAFVPTLLLVLFCYTGRPPLPLAFDAGRLLHTGSDRGALYTYITDSTPADAVIVIDTAAPDTAISGNTAELPAMTGRVLLVERESHYIVKAHADSGLRNRIASLLVKGEALSEADDLYLADLARPIYIVDYHALDGDSYMRRSARDGGPLFQQGDVSLHRYTPGSGAAEATP